MYYIYYEIEKSPHLHVSFFLTDTQEIYTHFILFDIGSAVFRCIKWKVNYKSMYTYQTSFQKHRNVLYRQASDSRYFHIILGFAS